jgi:hypothetical protein
MSRRPALVTQADVARACRAAKALGSEWYVEIEARSGTIRVMQAPSDRPSPAPGQEPHCARGLDTAPSVIRCRQSFRRSYTARSAATVSRSGISGVVTPDASAFLVTTAALNFSPPMTPL